MSHRLVVLISGRGTNLQAILEAIARDQLTAEVALVVSSRADAGGLDIATRAGIPTAVVRRKEYPGRAEFDQALCKVIDDHHPDTLVLAGFMHVLGPEFVNHYPGRLLNIHPSLLPHYRGLDTHTRVLAAGDSDHGCSVHFVTEELDGGPLIARALVPVLANDTEETLSKRVQSREHVLYPLVLSWRASGRLRLTEKGVELDGRLLPPEGFQLDWEDHPGPVSVAASDFGR